MPKKLTLNEIKNKIFEKHGNSLELMVFGKNTHDPESEFKCNICGHQWKTSAHSVISGTGCKLCGIKKNADRCRNTIEYVQAYLAEYGCILREDAYINNETAIKVEFPCGHIYLISFGCFQRSKRCPQCFKENRKSWNWLSEEDIMNLLNENNLEFLECDGVLDDRDAHISYICKNGHITTKKVKQFIVRPTCNQCSWDKAASEKMGINHPMWKGTQQIRAYIYRNLKDWRKESMEKCGYRCVITGDNFDNIHHLYSFNKIVEEALCELGFSKKRIMGDYSQEEIVLIVNKTVELHRFYPLGVCLRGDIHDLFHSMYGYDLCVPEQFFEFQSRIQSGEIVIPN